MTDQNRLFPGQHFISTILDVLDAKTAMSGTVTRVFLMRAAMAGIIAGVMYLTYFAVVSGFASIGDGELRVVGQMAGAMVFGFALVFIYYTQSELLTSNMMIVSIGVYHRRTPLLKATNILVLCFLGNLLGGLAIAGLIWGSTLGEGGMGAQMAATVDLKLDYVAGGVAGWSDLFVRAVLCNLMINMAMLLVYNGRVKDDVTKSLAMIMAVFVFAFVGFEHSVANAVLFSMSGLKDGIDLGLAAGNIGIVLLGNFVGGGLLIGWYYAYANDKRRYLSKREAAAADPNNTDV